MVQLALRQKGFEVVEAENGAVGIEIARKELPDLILCDVNMERVDGYLTLSALRNEPTTGCCKAQHCNSVRFNLCCNALRRKYRQYFFGSTANLMVPQQDMSRPKQFLVAKWKKVGICCRIP